MQKRIVSFIQKHYVCTLCCTGNDMPWANAFYYAFDVPNDRLLYISSDKTRHAQLTIQNPKVAGTIFVPTRFNPSLQGLQFTGSAQILTGEEEKTARAVYKESFTNELIDKLPIWEVKLEYVRLIDRSYGPFATMVWKLGEPEVDEFEGALYYCDL